MKTRNGFVTNSSSTCYILDKREPGLKEAFESTRKTTDSETVFGENDTYFDYDSHKFESKEKMLIEEGYTISETEDFNGTVWKIYTKEIDLMNALDVGLGRSTSFCEGADLLALVKSEDYEYGQGLEGWIREWIERLGIENVLFIRESDEGSGGFLSEKMQAYISENALDEMEYH